MFFILVYSYSWTMDFLLWCITLFASILIRQCSVMLCCPWGKSYYQIAWTQFNLSESLNDVSVCSSNKISNFIKDQKGSGCEVHRLTMPTIYYNCPGGAMELVLTIILHFCVLMYATQLLHLFIQFNVNGNFLFDPAPASWI